jgi:hypothetical protein
VATPFVTGAIALLWSLYPQAPAEHVRFALLAGARRALRRSIVPPLLDAGRAWYILNDAMERARGSAPVRRHR